MSLTTATKRKATKAAPADQAVIHAADTFVLSGAVRSKAEADREKSKAIILDWLDGERKTLSDGRNVFQSTQHVPEAVINRKAHDKITVTISPPPA